MMDFCVAYSAANCIITAFFIGYTQLKLNICFSIDKRFFFFFFKKMIERIKQNWYRIPNVGHGGTVSAELHSKILHTNHLQPLTDLPLWRDYFPTFIFYCSSTRQIFCIFLFSFIFNILSLTFETVSSVYFETWIDNRIAV